LEGDELRGLRQFWDRQMAGAEGEWGSHPLIKGGSEGPASSKKSAEVVGWLALPSAGQLSSSRRVVVKTSLILGVRPESQQKSEGHAKQFPRQRTLLTMANEVRRAPSG
jgi:hypothetical protein